MATRQDPEHDAGETNSDGPLSAKLVKFRHVIGIHTNGSFRSSKQHHRPGDNIGIYARVIKEEKWAAWRFAVVSTLIEASFLSQIAIGAALTALGASDASHIAITVLGSANTVIAGIQTYLKGQGLPTRIQQYEFGLRKLREHIEDLERQFQQPDCTKDVDKETREIAEMYHAVRQSSEENTPDTYKAVGGAGVKLFQKSSRSAAASSVTPKSGHAESSADDSNVKADGTVDAPKATAAQESGEAGNSAGGRNKENGKTSGIDEQTGGSSSQGVLPENGPHANDAGESEETPLLKKL